MPELTLTTPTDRTIRIERAFAAPRSRVFDCYFRPELVKRWMTGPEGWSFTVCTIDLRVGGTYRFVQTGPEGAELAWGGVYREVVVPERVVSVEKYDMDWTGGETLGTLEFFEKGGQTTVVTTLEFVSKEARDGALKSGMAEGMGAGFAKMDGVLGRLAVVEDYTVTVPEALQTVVRSLSAVIDRVLVGAESKMYHGSPVWFVDDNPVCGVSLKKAAVQLLFWSGQSFATAGLTAAGKHKAAEKLYSTFGATDEALAERWLEESKTVVWNYRDIRQNEGELKPLVPTPRKGESMSKIATCLWFDHEAEEAMEFYLSVFPNSRRGTVSRYGPGAPLPEGTAMMCTFTLEGVDFMALNGGPVYRLNPAVSLYVDCADQAEVDRLWDTLVAGGEPSRCGWLVDRFGLSWQVIPRALGQLMSDPDPVKAGRVVQAMLAMDKIDVAGLERAFHGQ